ncbi:beta strand repeat-containing protein [Listeria grandensis]|uniref:beta strand repeat-containing protein n=1 Tax=Listeria grandensis TaxID=1494963 RepID=UPI00164CF713|nr:Ig-like domain-containing protein [Listeria grandensis]MBC6314154.1 hypothetical protein [Listeria grandensis]
MKKNMKKIAIALLATNVIASTVLTALPPVETHAAENKLTATQSQNLLNIVTNDDRIASGHIPDGAGAIVTITVSSSPYELGGSVLYTTTGVADKDGNYSINIGFTESRFMFCNVSMATDNGYSAGRRVQNRDTFGGGYFAPIKVGDTTISGQLTSKPNMRYQLFIGEGRTNYPTGQAIGEGVTDANGNFSATVNPIPSGRADIWINAYGSTQGIMSGSIGFNGGIPTGATSISLNTPSSIDTMRGTTGKVEVSVNPIGVSQAVTFTSSNPSIMTIDASGNWTAVAPGSASITVTPTANPDLVKTIPVTVTATLSDVARASVNDLFISNNPANHIKDTTVQATIDAAQVKVNAITNDTAQKNELQVYINKAQEELNARTAAATKEAEATTAVNGLFIDNNPTNHIKDTTTQAKIDAAQLKVDAVTDTTKKAELQTHVDKAQTELDAKNTAKASVDALFSDAPTNTKLKPSTTQAMINDASAKVNALPASAEKTAMQADITKANTLFEAITPTTLSDLTTESTTLSGFGEPNSAIVIKNGDTQIASGSVSSDGTYLFNITKLAAGSTITATVTKASNGKTSSASKTVQDTSIVTTKIDAMTVASTTVSGTGEPNATIVIKNGSTQIASGSTAGDGKFLFFVTPQAGGSTITATVTKTSNGKISSASTTVVDNAIVSTTMGALTTDSTSVTGVGEPNSAIVIKNGSTQIASGSTAGDGKYLFYVTPQAAGSTITATVTKASNGKTSSASQVVADSGIAPTKMNALTSNSTTITGTGEPNAAIVIKNGNTQIASGSVAGDGKFLFNITKQAGGSTITATVTKASNGKTSTATQTIPIATTTIGALTTDSILVSGTGERNGTIVIKNGATQIASGSVSSTGTYSLSIAKQAAGATITATVTANGKTSSASTNVVDNSIKATTLNALNTNSTSVSGTGEPNSAVVITKGATILASGTTDGNGKYQIAIAKQLANTTVTATVTKASNSKTSSASKTVTAVVLDYSLTGPETYDLGSKANITGTYGANVTYVRLRVTGASGDVTIKKQVSTTTSSNAYNLGDISTYVDATTQKLEIIAVDAKYNVVNTVVVAINKDTLDNKLTGPANYTIGDKTAVKGEYGTNIAYVRLRVIPAGQTTGTIVRQATRSAGNYDLGDISTLVTDATSTVEILGVDAKYNIVKTLKVTVKAPTVDNKLTGPASYTVGDKTAVTGTTGTGVAFVRLRTGSDVNNMAVVRQTTPSAGTYSLGDISSLVKDTSGVVQIVAIDKGYNIINTITVTVKAAAALDNKLTGPASYTFGDTAAITGTVGTNVSHVRLRVTPEGGTAEIKKNINLLPGATDYNLGNIAGLVKNATDKVEILALDASYQVVNTMDLMN